jgi:hypothetical protein
MIRVLGLTAIGLSGLTIAAADASAPMWVQFGGLGLAGSVVAFLCVYLRDLTKQHREERMELVKELKDLTRNDHQRFNRLANLLEKRPCLIEDGGGIEDPISDE